MAPPINKAKQSELNDLFAATDPESQKPYTLERISEMTGVPVATVAKYRTKFDERRSQEAEMEETTTRPRPDVAFATALRDIAGFGEDRLDRILRSAKAIPGILENPQALYQFLVQGQSLKDYHAGLIVSAVASAAQQQSGPAAPYFPSTPPPQAGGAPFLYGPHPSTYGIPPNQFAPYAPQPNPYAPQYGLPPAPPYYPPPPPTVTEKDVRAIVAETMDKALEKLTAALRPTDANDGRFEEVQEPLLDANGHPIMGENGPLMRWRRIPIAATQRTPPAPDILDTLVKLRTAGILPDATKPTTTPDATITSALEQIRVKQAETESHLAAERARREEADKWQAKLAEKDDARHVAELRAATAGLDGTSQVLLKAVDKVDKVTENAEKRTSELFSLARVALSPDAAKNTIPPSDAEIAALASAAERLDAAAAHTHATTPAAETTSTPATVPTEGA